MVSGARLRAFYPAGGLHHAHRDRAAGFCVYNDLVVAIASVTAEHPGVRIAYVDLDAHHGDGVQEAFYERADVLTVSVHESGTLPVPGNRTRPGDRERCRDSVSRSTFRCRLTPVTPATRWRSTGVVAPALRAFSPDVIVAQLGADSHRDDPLTHLDTTVAGQYSNARRPRRACRRTVRWPHRGDRRRRLRHLLGGAEGLGLFAYRAARRGASSAAPSNVADLRPRRIGRYCHFAA